MNKTPNLTFFCELDQRELQSLFADNTLIKKLRALNANISLGIRDFSDSRADIVRKLTRAGIPLTAWLLLPKEQGYWTSLDSVEATVRCYYEFKKWSQNQKLTWAAVGLDIEPLYTRMILFLIIG
jgi:hypothetical protein